MKPFLAACSIRSPKLASISLIGIQKLLAKGVLDHDDIEAIMQALEQVWPPFLALKRVMTGFCRASKLSETG